MIRATTVEVTCDTCGEPVLPPCGSHFWTAEDVQHLRDRSPVPSRPRMICPCGAPALIIGPVIRSLLDMGGSK